MIKLYIEDSEINLGKDISISFFDYNSLFDAAEGKGSYTYNIDIDLRDPVNAKVYSHLNRLNVTDIPKNRKVRCIVDGILFFQGVETILSVDGYMAKIQVVCGNSELNFVNNDADISSLDLGNMPKYDATTAAVTLRGTFPGFKYVCTPVLTDECKIAWQSYWNVIANRVDRENLGGTTVALDDETDIIPQPYFIHVIEKVLKALGWNIKYNCLRNMEFAKRLILVHAFKTHQLVDVIPNWKISKFIEEVQKFFNIILVADDLTNEVSLYNINEYYSGDVEVINITKEDIVQETDVPKRDFNSEQGFAYNYDEVAYNLGSSWIFNRWKLTEDVKALVQIKEFNSFSDFDTSTYKNSSYYNKPFIFHAADDDTYWALAKFQSNVFFFAQVDHFKNAFGENYVESESQETSLNIVPAATTWLDLHPKVDGSVNIQGCCIPYAQNNDYEVEEKETSSTEGLNEWIDGNIPEKTDTSNNKLFLTQYLGVRELLWTHDSSSETTTARYEKTKYPQTAVSPFISGPAYGTQWNSHIFKVFYHDTELGEKLSMELDKRIKDLYSQTEHLNVREIVTVYYKSKVRHNVAAFYVINGRKYACVKNEYTFEKGHLSEVVKGTFVPYD